MRRIRPGKRHLQQDSEGGAAAVEFALVIPVLLLILCGIFDVGNLYLNMNMVNEAAREGARYVAVSASSTSVSQSALQTYIQTQYNNTNLTVTMSTPLVPQESFTVTVSEKVNILTPLISVFFTSNPVTVTGNCSMYPEFTT